MNIQDLRRPLLGLLAALLVAGCAGPANVPAAPTRTPLAPLPAPELPTATVAAVGAQAGVYRNPDLGLEFSFPRNWQTYDVPDNVLLGLAAPTSFFFLNVSQAPYDSRVPFAELVAATNQGMIEQLTGATLGEDGAIKVDGDHEGWRSEFSYKQSGISFNLTLITTAHNGSLIYLAFAGYSETYGHHTDEIAEIVASIKLSEPQVLGVPREEALVLLGGESKNPRSYDPAHGSGDNLVFSRLVAFDRDLRVVPELAESWEVSPDGTVYTFHLRPDARFHDGRPLVADDLVYSWERAADPATDSDTVLTYLGDVVGVREMHAGQADQISGIRALDEHTFQVTIDAPKPYFLMKLTYSTAAVVDRANIESGPEWYRTPNGTGPYRLIRWEPFKAMLYERNDDYYLDPPAIRFIVYQLYAGTGMALYETGAIDLTGVGVYNLDRVKDPTEPLNAELREGVSMCTSYAVFDVAQAPFDDPKVRQAFAMAFDRDRYLDVIYNGNVIPARGMFPPAMPGYSTELRGLEYDPERARQLLAESSYGGADKLPPIRFTGSGFGSDPGPAAAAMAEMWQDALGVTIEIENLEPNTFLDKLYDGYHGQLFSFSWCADYPDPENFADTLFHSGSQLNLGHYANPEVDALLDRARTEPDVATRIKLYQQAEQLVVDDAAGIFIAHRRDYALVKPYLKNYPLVPVDIPFWRYLSIER